MTDYHFPFWRRGVFVALLILVLALALIPPLSRGTVSIHLYSIADPSVVHHFYLRVSQLGLHTAGVPMDLGWVSITDNLPTLDLGSANGPTSPGGVINSQVQSGRYDQVKISIDSTIVALTAAGNRTQTVCTNDCRPIVANATIPVPPNGSGNLLMVVSPDYSTLLSSTPSLSLSVVQVTTP